ncbi:hypothetical protein [Candidatus Protochlamydia sp. W-9]|uniref:hypothetical protein n=1 Tax=Candidatus Protochlamydia sp. W-9 TaxID=1785087 RepID=UPI00096A80C9|nr:hypothetical protein [Candidatus Protochlamydia sp. W-9]
MNLIIAKLFYGSFQKKNLAKMTSDEANAIVSTYGLDKAFILDIKARTSKVTSMLSFIQFIKNNRAPLCNFQKISHVTNVKTFVQYIQDSSSFVRAVVMKKVLSTKKSKA